MADVAYTADTVDVTWALERLTDEKGVIHALLFASDGMALAASRRLGRDAGDRASAAFAGILATSRGLGEFCGRPDGDLTWRYDVKAHGDPDHGYVTVLVFAAGEHTGLAVSVAANPESREVAVAIEATLKTIAGLRHVLGARERERVARP
ncbi:MAG: roadblock/LC7 domain-containing protein [Stackebrandtia sp.]